MPTYSRLQSSEPSTVPPQAAPTEAKKTTDSKDRLSTRESSTHPSALVCFCVAIGSFDSLQIQPLNSAVRRLETVTITRLARKRPIVLPATLPERLLHRDGTSSYLSVSFFLFFTLRLIFASSPFDYRRVNTGLHPCSCCEGSH